jgi:hypothetical protein
MTQSEPPGTTHRLDVPFRRPAVSDRPDRHDDLDGFPRGERLFHEAADVRRLIRQRIDPRKLPAVGAAEGDRPERP